MENLFTRVYIIKDATEIVNGEKKECTFHMERSGEANPFGIEAMYGIKGFAIIVRLWQKIYAEKRI